MNILLLGEFSSLYKNLNDGLTELGHNSIIAAHGDGYKKIPCDIYLGSRFSGLLEKIELRFKPIFNIKQLVGYDVVQIINPFLFNYKYFPRSLFLDTIIKSNKKFFISGAGDDAFTWKYGRKRLKYGHFDDFLKYDLNSDNFYMDTTEAFKFNERIIEKSNGIIPIMYEYEISYKNHYKRLNTIPIPINVNKITYRENNVSNKLVVFHGLNRYGSKGTRHVEKAFDLLKKKYPNDLELIIKGKMNIDEYLQIMRRANVVIDQMYSYSLGVNGVYALAMGKIVMGGAEPESLVSLNVKSSPVINLSPNFESIIQEIELLLEQKNNIQDMGYMSRKFAESVHGHIKVAKQYVETWSLH